MIVAVELGERFKDKTVCFVGAFSYRFQEQVSDLIIKEQGTVVEEVSETLSYLVIGTSRGVSAKQKQAEKLNKKGTAFISLLDEDDFAAFWRLDDETIKYILTERGRHGIELWNLVAALHSDLTATISEGNWKGRDLSNAKLATLSLESLNLAESNLLKAVLPQMNGCDLGGAIMQAALLPGSSNCDFSNVDLTRASVWGTFTSCTFDGARFAKASKGWARPDIAEAKACSFKNCSGANSDFTSWNFTECDFSNADFEAAWLYQCRFEKCIMTGASFSNADLTDCIFESCELGFTNFQGAILGGAHFSETCLLTNANFKRAVVAPSAVEVLKRGNAAGLSECSAAHTGLIGESLRTLALEADAAHTYSISAYLDINDKEIVLFIGKYTGWTELLLESGLYAQNKGHSRFTAKGGLADAMLQLAKRWPSGALRQNSANVDIKGTKLKPAALAKLCNLAWAEACGMPDDASAGHHRQDGSKNQRKNQRTVLLDDLRGGPNGVARWNDRSQNQRTATGPFRGLDFGGVDLESAELSDCDFRGSSFKGANLRYARLYFTDLKKVCFQGACLAGATCIQMKASEADFSDADLTGTRLCRSNLSNSKFANAQLERTNFEDCNLCGADLSTGLQLESAQLSGAQFDHKTRFPVNFVLPQALRWSGAGVDPRPDAQGNRRVVQSNVTHFNDFLHNLRLIVQEDRLLKAMKMLKSDRFKLFSEYTESELIGVVKSQSDPDLVYACSFSNGSFGCCTQNLNVCGGLRGAVCKHLLVLLVGLTKSESISAHQADILIQTTCGQKPSLDKQKMTEVFLRYRGAENGDFDWRPTETVPEDYY